MEDEISEIFKKWNRLKIRIHKSERFSCPKIREIWWVSIGQNIGIEINGKNHKFERPVVVIKIFNNYGFLVAPITGKIKYGKYFIHFINNKYTYNSVNMSQIRSISVKRFIRMIGEMEVEDFDKIKNMLMSFAS